MDRRKHRGSFLRDRLLAVLGVASVAAPVGAACGGKVAVDGLDGQGGRGGSSLTSPDGSCELTTSGISTGTGSSTTTRVTECFKKPGSTCPTLVQAPINIIPSQACAAVRSIDCGPVEEAGLCCYLVTEEQQVCPGRPFMVEGTPRTSSAVAADRGWGRSPTLPAIGDLDAEQREELAQAWTRDALLEHASIASFSKFALELLAVGAPAELVALAHEAALDEIRHAELCFSLAGAYGVNHVAPSAMKVAGALGLETSLAAFAASVLREGCLGETLSVLVAEEQLSFATDPAVIHALETIVEDESRHAELAFRTVAWALRVGGPNVRTAVRDALADAAPAAAWLGDAPLGERAQALCAHGLIDAERRRRVIARGLAEVVLPCARALLRSAEAPTAADAHAA
jgi:hypothetical protein